jgi:signal transduction histidine kinase
VSSDTHPKTKQRARCLVLETDAARMQLLCSALEQCGYASHGSLCAQQALQGLLPGETDLLLVNMTLPSLDGIALCNAARQIDPELGFVLLTDDARSDIAKAVRSGIFDFIIQPFEIESLSAILEHALESRVTRQSVALLQEEALRQCEQRTEAARDSETSLGPISHDLRAPLRTIAGFAQILEEDFAEALGQEGQRIVQIIRGDTQKLDEMIIGLLDFSRAGSRPFEREPVNMTELARSAANEILQLHAGSEPVVSIEELPAIDADYAAMRQVWVNLIGNALKFSGHCGQPRVSIRGHVEGSQAHFQIEDNGAGFDMRHVDKLFGIFERLHRSDEFAGRGIGLAIVKRVIARHGGKIHARGVPDHGACFEFLLPGGVSCSREIQPGAYL